MRTVKTARRSLWHPACWPSWLGLACLWLIARLPLAWATEVAAAAGPLLQRLLRSRARIAARNLELCFPELDDAARAALLRENFRDLGRMLVEFAWGWLGSPARVARIAVEIEGLERLQRLRAEGRGILLVGAHFSHLELAARLLTQHWPVAGMYREHHDPAFEWAIRKARLRYASAMFRRDELRATVKHLKAGGTLWYAPDQEYRRGERLFVPFFGIPASSVSATHQLARLSGAAVVGFMHQRVAPGRYRIRLLAPLEDFPSADVAHDTTRVNAVIETIIRAAPSQYLWAHARFKTRPPEAPEKLYR